jgi:SAM-dependent methyltransferase
LSLSRKIPKAPAQSQAVISTHSVIMLVYSLDTLNEIRQAEMDLLLQKYPAPFSNADVLELGAGACRQLAMLEDIAKFAVGVDVPASHYHPSPVSRFVWYDGSRLPFSPGSFNVIYSSNVMEHVLDEESLHKEMQGVLQPHGIAIHVVPSSVWRLWTTAIYFFVIPGHIFNFIRRNRASGDESLAFSRETIPKPSLSDLLLSLICPRRHGEKGNRFTEWWHFRKASWHRRFEDLGWTVVSAEELGLFYTGYLLGSRFLSIEARKRLARFLGSACLIFVLKPKSVQ